MILSVLKTIDAPGSLLFLAVCVTLGLAVTMLWPRGRRLAYAWLGVVSVVYLALTLPFVASAIANRLPRLPPNEPSSWTSLDTLVVLDGDNREGRVKRAIEVFQTAAPNTVWLVGNLSMLDPLQQAGIPWAHLMADEEAATTREQVAHISALVERHAGPTAVIASRLQMPRIAALVHAQGIHVLLIDSPADQEPPTLGASRFVPNYGALCVSRDAIYEHAALAYYRWQGWIG